METDLPPQGDGSHNGQIYDVNEEDIFYKVAGTGYIKQDKTGYQAGQGDCYGKYPVLSPGKVQVIYYALFIEEDYEGVGYYTYKGNGCKKVYQAGACHIPVVKKDSGKNGKDQYRPVKQI